MDFLLLASLVGIAVTLVTGPLGCFIVWRKMAYFGDTLAHSALLGVALGLAIEIHIGFAIFLIALMTGVAMVLLQRRTHLSSDTLLGILSHAALALGLVSLSLFSDQRVDLYGYLFGDLLTVSVFDVAVAFGLALVVLGALAWAWQPLLRATLDEDLAKVEGVHTEAYKMLLMVLLALVIAFAMRVVGVLLITALLIIPAAGARYISLSPEAMAKLSSVIGMLSVGLGLLCSLWLDVPAGPSIVLVATGFFLVTRFGNAHIPKLS